MLTLDNRYFVMCWRSRKCYVWHNMEGVPSRPEETTLDMIGFANNRILIPVDPLTAISMGMVTPEQLGYPPGILAAFNLLSKEPS